MKLNRKLMMVLALVLSVAMATSGTIAYLTDADKDVNVMTLGKVEIRQNEQERIEDHKLDDFSQDKPLMPAVYEGTSIPWADAADWVVANNGAWRVVEDNVNVVDKMVTVTNTGKSDAYVRTIIAYEGDPINGTDIHVVQNSKDTNIAEVAAEFAATEYIENVVIDNVRYDVIVYTYANALAPGKTTIPSLKQIYMDKTCDNEQVEKYGEKYDVIVLSQAVQAAGFENAAAALEAGFGAVTAEKLITWIAETEQDSPIPGTDEPSNNPPAITVNNNAELAEALSNVAPGQTVNIAAKDYDKVVDLSGELNDVTLAIADGAEVKFNIPAGAELNNVTIKGLNTSSEYINKFGGNNTTKANIHIANGASVKNLIVEDSNIEIPAGGCAIGVAEPSAEITLKNSTITGDGQGKNRVVYGSGSACEKVTIENCHIKNMQSWILMFNKDDVAGIQLTINGNTIENCTGGIAKVGVNPNAKTVFTNNIVIESDQHKNGNDYMGWFTIKNPADTITVGGNTLDGVEWIPGTAQGLGA